MRIRSLELRARVVVDGFLRGLHRSQHHGFSVEFSEYRQYSPGDDPRQLDWRVYARSDRHYVKRFEDETNLRCHLLLDNSRSMGWGSLPWTKADYARTVAATLACFLARQRDAVGLLTFDEGIVDHVPARWRPGHLHRLVLQLETPHGGTGTDLAAPLERVARLVTKRGLVVLVSDLLGAPQSIEGPLRALRAKGHEVILIRVLDPAEERFEFSAPSMFRDIESGREIYVDPESARRGYLERFAEHSAALERVCGDLGIDLLRFSSDRPLELALLDFLVSRAGRRARPARRAGAPRGGSGRGSAAGRPA